MTVNFKTFESPEAFADYAETVPSRMHNNADEVGKDAFAGVSYSEAIYSLRNGNTENLEAAKKIIDQMNNSEIFANNVPIIRPDVVGMVPNVPGVVSGHPQGMMARHFEEMPSLNAPITVYFEAAVSAGVTHEQLVNRGVAALAFVLAMELVRPVDLYIVCLWSHTENKGVYGPIVKVASRPMDIGRATYMMTDPSFYRRLAFSSVNNMAGIDGRRCSKPWAFGDPTSDNYIEKARKHINFSNEDVYIKGGYLFDTLMLNDPITWVKQMIEKHNTNRELI